MKANYDPKNLQSVLLYMRQEFGREIFLSPSRMVGILGDLSPALGPDGNVLRQLGERGLLRELEQAAASGDNMKQTRIVVKIRDFLTNYLFLMDSKVDFYLTALSAVYAVQSPAAKTVPKQAQPKPTPSKAKPTPTPPSKLQSIPILWNRGEWKPSHAAPPKAQPTPTPQSKPAPQPKPVSAPQARTVASGQAGDNLTWTLDADGTLTISGHGEMENYREFFDDPPWKSWKGKIKLVSLKDGVTTIGESAFSRCDGLTAVTIPPSVTSISDYAFYDCWGLTAVTIPSSVVSIGNWAFSYCENLKTAIVPRTLCIPHGAFPPQTQLIRK